jgi:hypothetical protein
MMHCTLCLKSQEQIKMNQWKICSKTTVNVGACKLPFYKIGLNFYKHYQSPHYELQ